MTALEVRDRLDQRFRLLVGSRRSLERHQTLRHAVAWSYDLLSADEKTLLERCSVFAGGFDLESSCAVASPGQADDFAVLDMLDALVRKSLLVVGRPKGRTRYSMLETIRQFAEEKLAEHGEPSQIRGAHARYFADRETQIFALWDSPRQREALDWFAVEVANLRAAFRWSADHDDLDDAVAIAILGSYLGIETENFEPVAWAEELIEPARTASHSRLAGLYVMAAQCYHAGRAAEAIGYSDAGASVIDSTEFDAVPFGHEGALCGPYIFYGQPGRAVDWCRGQLDRGRDTHGLIRANLVLALMFANRDVEARAATQGLVDTAEATHNPWALSFALFAYGHAHGESDPPLAREAMRRGLAIAQDIGIGWTQTNLAGVLARLEGEYGDPIAALDYAVVTVRNYYDAGNPAISIPLAILVAFFDKFGHYEAAATIAGFADSPLTATGLPWFSAALAHLREVLGDQAYETLADEGGAMATSEIARYAYDQIDQARAELIAP